MLHFHVVTLFPESIEPYLKTSIIGRAIATKKIKISYYDPKKFTRDPIRNASRPNGAGKYGRVSEDRVDRRPYGGGPGMVLRPEPFLRAVKKAIGNKKVEIIFFATDGAQFDEKMAKKLAGYTSLTSVHKSDLFRQTKHIVFICGHYEGIDARVQKILKAKKVSVGPYVLTGGELPAATVIDAVARFVPGVLGKAESLEASRVSSPEVYTRPETLVWKGKKYRVPKVLLSGHHGEINEWKNKKRGLAR